jgi:hypothetical protein
MFDYFNGNSSDSGFSKYDEFSSLSGESSGGRSHTRSRYLPQSNSSKSSFLASVDSKTVSSSTASISTYGHESDDSNFLDALSIHDSYTPLFNSIERTCSICSKSVSSNTISCTSNQELEVPSTTANSATISSKPSKVHYDSLVDFASKSVSMFDLSQMQPSSRNQMFFDDFNYN